MYLVAVREPLIEFGRETLIRKELLLHVQRLRDALDGCLGTITILAPIVSKGHAIHEESLVPFVAQQHGLRLAIACQWNSADSNESPVAKSAYEFTLSKLLKTTVILQTDWQEIAGWGASPGILDLVRKSGTRLLIVQRNARTGSAERDKAGWQSVRSKIEAQCEKTLQRMLACADLSLFDSQNLLRRFGPLCRNARLVRSSGSTRDEVISLSLLEERNRSIGVADPIRLAFVDSLTEAHGIHHAVAIVRRAIGLGANLNLQICNDGPERQVVRYQLAKTLLEDRIVLKALPPSSALIRETLESSHGLLRTPLSDVDDQSAFMGFSAGLPMISYDESIALTHAAEHQSVVLMPQMCIDTAARLLLEMDQNREWLLDKSLLARKAGLSYSIENAYQLQAEHILRLVEDENRPHNYRNHAPTVERMSRELAATTEES